MEGPLAPPASDDEGPAALAAGDEAPSTAPALRIGGRTAALLVVPVATLVASAIGTALAPTLLVESPELLLVLDPRPTHLVLAAPSLPAATYFAIAIVRWFVADPFFFQVGRERGPAAVAWLSPRSGKVGRWFMRLVLEVLDRAAPLVVFFASGPLVCLLVGVQQRMRLRTFVVLDVVGSVVTLAILRAFGDRFAEPIGVLTAFVREHLVELTVASTVLVVIVLLVRWRRRVVGARIASSS